MITTNYEVKILDFGGARDFGSARGRSMSIMLKSGYAPEEQYRTHGEQGPWTNVYALCATMYRCITGQIPPESMERTYQDHLRPVTDFQPDCPREVNFAICKGLNVYKDDRWQSMEELSAIRMESDRIREVVLMQRLESFWQMDSSILSA